MHASVATDKMARARVEACTLVHAAWNSCAHVRNAHGLHASASRQREGASYVLLYIAESAGNHERWALQRMQEHHMHVRDAHAPALCGGPPRTCSLPARTVAAPGAKGPHLLEAAARRGGEGKQALVSQSSLIGPRSGGCKDQLTQRHKPDGRHTQRAGIKATEASRGAPQTWPSSSSLGTRCAHSWPIFGTKRTIELMVCVLMPPRAKRAS